ncbi:MAG: phenylalanine--tRNA ligase subunit beta, partial [Candidatus Peribacteraceae bacterium]
AHIGAQVQWHGQETMILEKAKIRGEQSEGMICAAEELGLSERFPECTGHCIIDLGDGTDAVGEPLAQHLGMTDTVLDIDNHAITHRPDLFSQLGFARECVAIGLATWKKKQPSFDLPTFPKASMPFKQVVECKDLIPRYCGCTLSIDSIGETPEWMRRRLESVGVRSLLLPVDITNYVMLEVGMPLHSFDVDDLKGDVHIRLSKKGEKVVTLDEVERPLPDGAIVLSDDAGIFDLLGIMGGLRSSTKEGTKHVYLHSVGVDSAAIRRGILGTGHRTDAATIYEKGIPNSTVALGFARALALFLELVPGAKITSALDPWGDDGTPEAIDLPLSVVTRKLGTNISAKQIEKILTDLECTVKKSGGTFSVTPPRHRLRDLKGAHDLIEEIGRIYGYDSIAPVLPLAAIDPPAHDERIHRMRDALKEEGFAEILPLSLWGPGILSQCKIDQKGAITLENPLGEELSLLQPSTLPGLLEHAQRNLQHVEKALRTFYWGQVFYGDSKEHMELGALVANRAPADLQDEPLLSLKANLRHALDVAGYALKVVPAQKPIPAAHPGRSADLFVGDKRIGELFELHPSVRDQFDLPYRAAVVQINLSELFACEPAVKMARGTPQFPAIAYDATVTVSHSMRIEQALNTLRGSNNLLESVDIIDLYDKGVAESDGYRLTLRFTYRALDRTLEEEEIKKLHTTLFDNFLKNIEEPSYLEKIA